jgi:hypothetical protein
MAIRCSTGRWTGAPVRRAVLAALALAYGLPGCGGPALVRYEEAVDEAPTAAVHAVHEERLRALMRELDGQRNERLPTAIDPVVETRRQAREVERVARAMAESARALPGYTPSRLAPEEAREFRVLAEQLARRSDALAEEAEWLTPAQRRERLTEIDSTCDACHARFRIPGGSRDEP